MNNLDLLRQAIRSKSSISFKYDLPEKVHGTRRGDPYAVFIIHKNDGTESTKVHILQTDGVTESNKPFPSFRMFNLQDLSNIIIINNDKPFPIHPDYNPNWIGYEFIIEKV